MDAFVTKLSEQPVLVENGLCSRFRCSKSKCVACAAVCPVRGAVRLTGDTGVEITDACIACGACVSACPNGALRPAESDKGIAERMRAQIRPAAPFRISCDRAEAEADLVLTCLSRLTEATVLEPIRMGAQRVEFIAPDCAGCRLEKAAPQWQRTLSLSSSVCQSAGLGADRVVRGEMAKPKPEGDHDLPDSRRALFRAVAKWTTDLDAAPEDETEPPPSEPFREFVQKHHENPKRSHLLEVLEALPGKEPKSNTIPAAAVPLAHLEVTSECTGCNVCETLCPVGALRHHEEDGTYTLDFEPVLCTGCRVCEAACLFNAIRMHETVDLSVLFAPSTVTLVRGEYRNCRACNETFLNGSSEGGNDSPLCPMCRVSDRRRAEIARQMVLGGILGGRSQ